MSGALSTGSAIVSGAPVGRRDRSFGGAASSSNTGALTVTGGVGISDPVRRKCAERFRQCVARCGYRQRRYYGLEYH